MRAYTFTFSLYRNPKAARSGTGLLRPLERGGFEWVRPLQRGRTDATYELEPGYYVLVTDESSHKNDRKSWSVVEVTEDGRAVTREEVGVWRENRMWGCHWWGMQKSYAFMARRAAEHRGRRAADMGAIEIVDAFLECGITTLRDPEHRHVRMDTEEADERLRSGPNAP